MKVLYKKNYIERDLYVLEYKGKYLMVYRSSGLNPGRKGRILPFHFLATPSRPTLSGETPGYIFKEWYFNNQYISHRKTPGYFGPNVIPFLEELEEFLKDHSTTEVGYSHVKEYKDLLPMAREINEGLEKAINGLEPFDWATLTAINT